MSKKREDLGITRRELVPGTAVMVSVGGFAAKVNGDPCLIAWAVICGPADENATKQFVDPTDRWWLDVYTVPGEPPLPQIYRAEEILGIPALGLHMDGAPER